MKYEKANYKKDDNIEMIELVNYTQDELKQMEEHGCLHCPGKDCDAKLCLVHNSKNGGRTYFLKATDDDAHSIDCEYKIDNYKPISIREPENGYFTEEQINNHVKVVDRDTRTPLRERKREINKKAPGFKKVKDEESQLRKTTKTGRVVYGEEGNEGTKGRMSRTYHINKQDIGKMTTIYGAAKQIYLDEYRQLHVNYKDERLGNIEVLAGPIIEKGYPLVYNNLNLVEKYFCENKENKKITVTAGGLIIEKNGRLVLELHTANGIRIDGSTINAMITKSINLTM